MMRVLKPGGELFCSAPFLQPYHGFPNHYYNMTHSGLVNLFPGMEIKKVDVPDYLHPMAAITWILNAYTCGLPEGLKKQFLSLTVENLLATFANHDYADHPLCRELPFPSAACACLRHVYSRGKARPYWMLPVITPRAIDRSPTRTVQRARAVAVMSVRSTEPPLCHSNYNLHVQIVIVVSESVSAGVIS